jgi:hypothetical protein
MVGSCEHSNEIQVPQMQGISSVAQEPSASQELYSKGLVSSYAVTHRVDDCTIWLSRLI